MYLADIMELFVLGMFGMLALSVASLIIWGFYLIMQSPLLIACAGGGILFIFMLGWCIKHWDDFFDLFVGNTNLQKVTPNQISYGHPTLDKLQQFEEKYYMKTIAFMQFVYNDNIPSGMNNLDYLEWVALVNDLPTISKKKKGE
jgi:hypothetical protein